MGKMGNGYGSEFHLLRYLGYHRNELSRALEKATGGRVIEWLDFDFGGEGKPDREWKGVDFLDSASGVKSAWLEFWPQSGNVPNWDAVGRLESNSEIEWLLVEAKAHVEELQSSCMAKEAKREGGLDKIKDALKTTIKANGFAADVDGWLKLYYQYTNRLAHLRFLIEHGIPTRLVFIYFCGDNWGGNTLSNERPPICPKDANGWGAPLQKVHSHLGLSGQSKLEESVARQFAAFWRHGASELSSIRVHPNAVPTSPFKHPKNG